MKKLSITLILAIIIFCFMPIYTFAATPSTSARGAVLMEVETGRVLYEKNPHEKMPMASTTKIMTAILALEKGNLSDIVTVSRNASGVEGSSLYLAVDEKLTLEQLLYGLMLRSGNDAAVAIAEHIGGSVEEFAKMMNKKAREIGAFNTNFVNPHGLHHKDHYTTAYDLALISAYAMKNPKFVEIASTKYYKIPWPGQPWDRALKNKNALLWDYEGANGIKTGYTKASGRCLATAALRENMQLVCVVLNCQPWFDDSMAILDYGFKEYKPHEVLSSGDKLGIIPVKDGFEDQVEILLNEDVVLPIQEGEEKKIDVKIECPERLTAPVKAGDKVGYVKVSLGNELEIIKELYAAKSVEENTFRSNIWRIIRSWIF